MESNQSNSSETANVRILEMLVLAVSVVAVIGSLYLSMGMHLKACPLCLYERTFLMGVAGVLLIGLSSSRDVRSGFTALMSLPLTTAGLGVAAFHVYLELTGVLECPAGLLGLGTAPQQSLAAFLLVVILTAITLIRCPKEMAWQKTALVAVVVGVLFSGAAIKSAPPLPKTPTEPYTTPMEGCRPAFQPETS